ncbi:MAG TPA: DUF2950 domain-containing protein [Desulfuromonadales bacterium]|nr:DUF2950 domain-containing protein [Desulfuromonadales bacterium]
MKTFSGGLVNGGWMLGLALFLSLTICLPVVTTAQAAAEQTSFSTPQKARHALITAVTDKDHKALKALFGPEAADLEPGDPVEQAAEFAHFARHIREDTALVMQGKNKAVLLIGKKKWPFPVPIVKKNGGWFFDTAAGSKEILTRRIGHNELLAINACRAYVDAQRDYYNMPDPDGVPIPKYAQRMISSPGEKDGPYWPTVDDEAESPFGPLVAEAREEGYLQKRKAGEHGRRPFHGYYFRILKAQGPDAVGGKYSYVINGNMVAGFALIAYPARWGVSGVMTFIVNQRGRVYQKDLGPQTGEIVPKIQAYNPDLSWKVVDEP